MSNILGLIAESNSAYCDICYCSVVCLSVCLYVCHTSHSSTLPLGGMRCHLAGTRVVPSNTVLDRGPVPQGKRQFGGRNAPPPSRSHAAYCQIIVLHHRTTFIWHGRHTTITTYYYAFNTFDSCLTGGFSSYSWSCPVTFENCCRRLFAGRTPFLSPNKRRQSSEGRN